MHAHARTKVGVHGPWNIQHFGVGRARQEPALRANSCVPIVCIVVTTTNTHNANNVKPKQNEHTL